jgi:hypothetical protein
VSGHTYVRYDYRVFPLSTIYLLDFGNIAFVLYLFSYHTATTPKDSTIYLLDFGAVFSVLFFVFHFIIQQLDISNRIGGVIVSVLSSSAVDRGFEPRVLYLHKN